MAKNNNDLFGDIFGELNKTAQGGQAANGKPSEQPSTTTAVPQVAQTEKPATAPGAATGTNLQGKQGKLAKQGKQEKKVYDYGTKRTFPIPDELWNDALIVMQAQGKKQVEFIQDLIRSAVEENKTTIETVKRMRGEL